MSAKRIPLTIAQAMAAATAEIYDEQQWLGAEKVFKLHRLCPHCACDGRQVKLGRLQDSTPETYAGRECTECDEFVPDIGQTDWCEESHFDCHSDADPGL